MGAHTALRPRTLGSVAGRGALTAAAALALTGGTASVAFAGTYDDDSTSHRSWGHDDRDSDYKDGFRDGYRLGYHDGEDADDDCDDDGGWHHDHGRWDDKGDRHHDKDRGDHRTKDRDHRGTVNGASYGGNHYGDDQYTITNTVNKGLLAGIL